MDPSLWRLCLLTWPKLLYKSKMSKYNASCMWLPDIQLSETLGFSESDTVTRNLVNGYGFINHALGEVFICLQNFNPYRELRLKSTWMIKKTQSPSFIMKADIHTSPDDTDLLGLERTPYTVKLHSSPAPNVQRINIFNPPQFLMTPTLSTCMKSHHEIQVQWQWKSI